MFSWVLIIVLKNNVILMKDGGGGGGAFAENFRSHYSLIYLHDHLLLF